MTEWALNTLAVLVRAHLVVVAFEVLPDPVEFEATGRVELEAVFGVVGAGAFGLVVFMASPFFGGANAERVGLLFFVMTLA